MFDKSKLLNKFLEFVIVVSLATIAVCSIMLVQEYQSKCDSCKILEK